jgi:hypothetical protein
MIFVEMENNRPHPITVLPVIDTEDHVVRMIHLIDLLDMTRGRFW